MTPAEVLPPSELVAWSPLLSAALAALVAGVVAGVFLLLNRRGAERDRRSGQTPPTWPEIWARMTELEERVQVRDRAFANILRDAADQWPKETPGPVFADEDIQVLEDTIPARWLKNGRKGG